MDPLTLLGRWGAFGEAPAIVWRDTTSTYRDLLDGVQRLADRLEAAGLQSGEVVTLQAEFSPTAVAALLALWKSQAIVQLLPPDGEATALSPAASDWLLTVVDDSLTVERGDGAAAGDLLERLRQERAPGLLLRTSGSTGQPKTIVHHVHRLLRKFERRRTGYRTIAFLLFDHIGGIDTLFVTLANGGCLVVPESRSPDTVAAAVARHGAEVLPASPTFLNLLLISAAHERHDLSCLRIVTYGTEVMPSSVLQRLAAAMPHVQLIQKFGMSELGTLRSRSQASDSPWVQIGGDGVHWRVADGLLEIRSDTAMLGYLDAPSPFTEDGWLRTGDAVEVDGDYLRFLGRRSEIINVGGLKVYPSEIETVLLQAPGVLEATVCGEANPLIGTLVKAVVRVDDGEGDADARARLRRHCLEHLPAHQVPQRLEVTRDALHTARFKARRQGG